VGSAVSVHNSRGRGKGAVMLGTGGPRGVLMHVDGGAETMGTTCVNVVLDLISKGVVATSMH
jgi:hypothetical protein